MHQAMAEGIRLFNAQRFFEAHEALEALWLEERGDEKVFLHGLIQVAAAFHHQHRGNREGFRSLLVKGVGKMRKCAGARTDIDLPDLLNQLQPWLAAAGTARPQVLTALPQIQTLKTGGAP